MGSVIMSASDVAPVLRVLVLLSLSLSIASQCQRQLVVGGYDGSQLSSVEIFPPPSTDTFSIPDLPGPRNSHSISLLPGGRLAVCGGLLTSGAPSPEEKTCIAWTEGSTSWTHLHTTSTARSLHTAWTPPSLPNSIVLLGGDADATKPTAEIVPGGGTFALRHTGWAACGIPDEDTIVMTGGGGGWYSHDFVTRYNVNGFVEELPRMPENRYAHACAALPSTKAFIIAGGNDVSNDLSSVLTLLPGAQAWTPIAALPRSLYLARASIVGGRIRVTGGQDGSGSYRSEVLEYQPEPSNQWTTVGQLETTRGFHAALSIGSEALPCLPGASGTTTSPDPMLFFLIGLFFLCWNQYGLCTNIVKEDLNSKNGTDFDAEAKDTNPEYESVDASQGTRASVKHSTNTQATDQNPDYEPSSIQESMHEDNWNTV